MLPGVGVRYDFTTRAGDQIGVIAHRRGRFDFLLYDRHDPHYRKRSIRKKT